MDNCTPVRIKSKDDDRFILKSHQSIWFRLDTAFKDMNKSKCFSWYGISKSLGIGYPLWANQFNLWKPSIVKSLENNWYSLWTSVNSLCNFVK